MASIVILKNGEEARRIECSGFDLENDLRNYIYENPEIIPIDEIEDGLKLFVAVREFQVESGRIDALGFDQKGNIYIIETKLVRNADKRTVVAQALDYGAALWGATDTQKFFSDLSAHTTSKFGKDFSLALAEHLEIEDVDDVLDNIAKNLSSGHIRFMIVMDKIEPNLKDLVRFINQNSVYDVYAVETSVYKDEDRNIMVTQLFGEEVKKEVGNRAEASTWSRCDETDFVQQVCESEISPARKEQILKLTGILKNLTRPTKELGFYHVKSPRLDVFRTGGHTFYFDDNGRINVFITSPEYRESKAAKYFRQVAKEMKAQNVFDPGDPDNQKTKWFVPAQFTDEDYTSFVNICENVARQMGIIENYSEKDFRNFVDRQEWTFAKSYAESAPHEYIAVNPDDSRRKDFIQALEFLFKNGVREKFYGQSYTRYILDGRKYWSMEQQVDDVDDETIILNRTQPENTFRVYEVEK